MNLWAILVTYLLVGAVRSVMYARKETFPEPFLAFLELVVWPLSVAIDIALLIGNAPIFVADLFDSILEKRKARKHNNGYS